MAYLQKVAFLLPQNHICIFAGYENKHFIFTTFHKISFMLLGLGVSFYYK